MAVVDLESTSTMEAVLAAVKSAFKVSSKGDASIQAAANEITNTSMWSLKNGQQVAKLSVPREAKPMDARVRVGWTSFRLRIHRPEATRRFKCHGFGHTQGSCLGPDLKIRLQRTKGKGLHRAIKVRSLKPSWSQVRAAQTRHCSLQGQVRG